MKGVSRPDFIVYTTTHCRMPIKKRKKKLTAFVFTEEQKGGGEVVWLVGTRFSHLAAFQPIRGHEAIV